MYMNIAQTLSSIGVTEWTLSGTPTNEQEFNSMFRKLVGVNSDGVAIESTDPTTFGVTWEQVKTKQDELQAEYDNNEYQRQRASEYPPITDYLDGVVKGDQAQIDAYIAACQAVKAKYPKV